MTEMTRTTAKSRKHEDKESKLLHLYSMWHVTRSPDFERRYLKLLGDILDREPHYTPRQRFQGAF
ncbi:hypothetical protein N9K06_00450 [Omnitrophica bacterium]|nr:hypothetical protein [Candidatus Omnitrophota bacterium]